MAETSARIPRGMSLCSVYLPYRYPKCWFPVFLQKSKKRSAIVWFSNMILSTCLYFCHLGGEKQKTQSHNHFPLSESVDFNIVTKLWILACCLLTQRASFGVMASQNSFYEQHTI